MTANNWLFLTKTSDSGEAGSTVLLNLDCVQAVEIISNDSLRLRFSETQTITMEGQAALDLVNHLMTRVVRFDHEPKV